MATKRHFYQSKHPFDAHPFEVFFSGSWQAVKSISIKNGTMTMNMNFLDNQYKIKDKGPYSNVRLRSRQATLSDCTCFLRPGVDICVFSNSNSRQIDGTNNEIKHPVWLDARISSIERRPHESGCTCQFYVNLYVNQGPLGSEIARLNRESIALGIIDISILQKLGKFSCEDLHYRWDFSEDCSVLPRTKLLLGKILSDISWLLVTSCIKKITFAVRSVKNKIVYQILEGDDDDYNYSNSNGFIYTLNFKQDITGMLVPTVVEFVLTDHNKVDPSCEPHEDELEPLSEMMPLRRSKRRNMQPERFLGCDTPSEIEIGLILERPMRIDRNEDDEMSLPLSYLIGDNASSYMVHDETDPNVHSEEELSSDYSPESNSKTKKRKRKSGVKIRKQQHESQLAIVPIQKNIEMIAIEPQILKPRSPPPHAKQSSEIPSLSCHTKSNPKGGKKYVPDLEDVELVDMWKEKVPSRTYQNKKYPSHCSFKSHRGERSYRKRTLGDGAYDEMINEFLKNMDCTSKEEPNVVDQWKEVKSNKHSDQRHKTEVPLSDDEEEMSEIDKLWKEMELALASAYILDDNEVSSAGVSSGIAGTSTSSCKHDYKEDDEIGIFCNKCGFVKTEIRYVSPPFVQNPSWNGENKKPEEDLGRKSDDCDQSNVEFNHDPPEEPTPEEGSENVWALIPELKRKLHAHQRKAFEFLWRNVAGSLEPAVMEQEFKRTGGCVISHSPGAGKTFLIIAFLVSYLKLFPGKRPLVLAPKTTLYTWYKEFIKWQIPIPVHLIHGRRTYRIFRSKSMHIPGFPKPTDDVKHILDCMEKIQKWHAQPSVLVMGYTSFIALLRDDSKFVHRRFMAKVLRESPGILILDEGHNPRSTKSRLRKGLMKVQTDLRILLSGTLFQNNFCEYFNTLCLARPKFVHEVLVALDPNYKRKKKIAEKARHLLESRARKYFLDNIEKKINSGVPKDRKQGLSMLRKMTSGFIDVYESGGSDGLPGLQIYTLLMNSTDIQHKILVKLQKAMEKCNGFPLELELLITLGSIHPWLVKTSVCANKFLTSQEIMELEQHKYDTRKGSKVKFVLNLVYRIVNTEKVLIFCHNIAPVKLLVELFERVFRWQRGKEVLVLTGDLDLFERGRVMDAFEEAGGESKVLLASITACGEGISLTAASRVILLDSEWNPSKTKQAIARAFRPGQQKVVYVYQLLSTGSLELGKYKRTTWKEWVSSMIFNEECVEDPSKWQAQKIEDEILREMVEEDRSKSFHMIMKNEKTSTN